MEVLDESKAGSIGMGGGGITARPEPRLIYGSLSIPDKLSNWTCYYQKLGDKEFSRKLGHFK